MSTTDVWLLIVVVSNVAFVFAIFFIERKKPHSLITWLFVVMVFPVLGFVAYCLIGGGLSFKTRIMLKKRRIVSQEYNEFIKLQKRKIKDRAVVAKNIVDFSLSQLMIFNINNSNSALFFGNRVEVFIDGQSKMHKLIYDIKNARHSINLSYYIFADDHIGETVLNELCEKAKQGIKVKLLYDSVGSHKSKRSFFSKLQKAGGDVAEFFPPFLGLRSLNFKINYRNHRKLAIIDGKIGYVGGVNIRDDHLGKNAKLSPWRDTHARIEGPGVHDLQITFFSDWVYAKDQKLNYSKLKKEGFFEDLKIAGNVMCQVVASGPDDNENKIENAMVKMISLAKKRICLQSPYFVPDETFFNALKQAITSEVQVDIMIPKLADKRIVHQASMSFLKDIISLGANVYLFDGFLHSKTLLVDDLCVSIGSCNMDNRSFSLNFEVNVFFFDKAFVQTQEKVFDNDVKTSRKIDQSFFKRKNLSNRLSQAFFRLFAPLL